MLEPIMLKIKELSRSILYWKDNDGLGDGCKESQDKFNLLMKEYLNLLKSTLLTENPPPFSVPPQLLEYLKIIN